MHILARYEVSMIKAVSGTAIYRQQWHWCDDNTTWWTEHDWVDSLPNEPKLRKRGHEIQENAKKSHYIWGMALNEDDHTTGSLLSST